ncbi:MAG: SIMPL domain-containing protein [Patescibacteria group bacterium]
MTTAQGNKECWHPCRFGKKILLTLLGVLLVYSVFYVGTLIRNNIKKYDFIGRADKLERTITVNGFGKVVGNNDIAVTTIGHSNTDKDVAKAQVDNKKVMDKVEADLKAMGIEDKDLQTNYSIFPDYNYTQDKGQELKGYRVTNTLTIKIRDLKKISDVLGLAGKYGATEVSGLSFTIDDPENLKLEARDKALADAKVKARKLADSLGVRLVALVSYNEYEGSVPDYYSMRMSMGAEGGGGGPAYVSGGSKDVTVNVNVTYEILSR